MGVQKRIQQEPGMKKLQLATLHLSHSKIRLSSLGP